MTVPGPRDLAPLMKPRSIAIIGASQRMSRATRVVRNLQSFGYRGGIFPINPKYDEVLGLRCFPDLASTPEPAESVVVAIPAEQVPPVLSAAVDSGVRAAVVLSRGFGEAGPAGQTRQAALERLAAERGLLVCGPNCYGVYNIRLGAAAFSADFAEVRAGRVAIVSQSGGFSHAIAEHLMRQRAVGLSYIVSCGNQAGVGVEDYVDFLVDDADTTVIGVFVEGFKRPERLRAVAARAAARRKPIVALKVGRSENARQAMLAHTGSLAGAPEIVEAVLRQAGIVQVGSIGEMIDTVALMSMAGGYARKSWRLAVLSGLGGECGNLSDVADRVGMDLPPLAASTVETLRRCMPDFANPRNPLDGTGAMYEKPEIFPGVLDVLLHDEAIDVVAFNTRVNVPPASGWAPARSYTQILCDAVGRGTDRLVLCFNSFAAGDLDPEVVRPLAEAGIPFLEGSETTLLALRNLRAHRAFLERPESPRATPPAPTVRPRPLGDGVLGGAEAARLLREFGIPLAETRPAKDAEQAVQVAAALGYPVALKIDSPDVVHKTDVGGVRLGCGDAAGVREAVHAMVAEVRRRAPAARIDGVLVQPMLTGGAEMIVGIKHDPGFGPAIVCGFGGIFVEVLRDVAVRVPPLDHAEALGMVAELRGVALLRGVRGRPPADVNALADVLVRVARLAETYAPSLRALDINPLVVLEEGRGAVALDWLIEAGP
jgi:acyl-CoA synthetase (NDP forming)